MARQVNQIISTTVLLDEKQATNALKSMEESFASLKKQRDALKEAGFEDWSEEVKKLDQQIKSTEKTMNAFKKSSTSVAEVIANMGQATERQLKQAELTLMRINKNIEPQTEAWLKNVETIKQIRARMDEVTAAYKDQNKEAKEQTSLLDKIKGSIGKFSGVAVAGAAIAGIIAMIKQFAQAAKEFIIEGVKMAASAQGITTAFNKISTDSKGFLKGIRAETKGLINDFSLMQATVRAKNFNIPIENMGKMLKFAQQRAQETGESVDHLVESIVNGIGKKSPLILDNLGISTKRLQEEVKKSGDFTAAALKIVNEELQKQGDLALTSADKATQAAVKWENAQLKVGERFKWIYDIWNEYSAKIADAVARMAGDTRTSIKIFDDQLNKLADLEVHIPPLIKRYEELSKKVTLNADYAGELTKEQQELIDVIKKLRESVSLEALEIDKAGRITKINTQKVYDHIEAQKQLLLSNNSERISTLETNKVLAEQVLIRLKQKKALAEAAEGKGGGATNKGWLTRQINKMSEEEKAALDTQIANATKAVTNANAELEAANNVTGQKLLEIEKGRIEARDKFNAMNQKQLNTWIKDEKNAKNQYIEIAKEIYDARFQDEEVDPDKAKKEADEKVRKQLEAIDIWVNAEKAAFAKSRMERTAYNGEIKELQGQMIDSDTKYNEALEKLEFESMDRRLQITNLGEKERSEIQLHAYNLKLKLFEKQEKDTKDFYEKMDAFYDEFDIKSEEKDKRSLIKIQQRFEKAQKDIQEAYDRGLISREQYEAQMRTMREASGKAEEQWAKEKSQKIALEEVKQLRLEQRQKEVEIAKQRAENLISDAEYKDQLLKNEIEFQKKMLLIKNLSAEDLMDVEMKLAKIETAVLDSEAEKKKRIQEEYEAVMKSSITGIGEAFGEMFSATEDKGKAFAEGMLDIIFDGLMRLVDIWLLQLQAKSVISTGEALMTNVGSQGIAGIATSAITAAAIQAALQVAKAGVKSLIGKGSATANSGSGQRVTKTKGYATGGFVSGGPGGYTGNAPRFKAVGVVHGGEYEVPQPVVQHPMAFAPIKALEAIRQSMGYYDNPLPGRFRRRGYADGGFVGDNPVAETIYTAPQTDPRLTDALESLEAVLYKLSTEGLDARVNYSNLERMKNRIETSRARGSRKK